MESEVSSVLNNFLEKVQACLTLFNLVWLVHLHYQISLPNDFPCLLILNYMVYPYNSLFLLGLLENHTICLDWHRLIQVKLDRRSVIVYSVWWTFACQIPLSLEICFENNVFRITYVLD